MGYAEAVAELNRRHPGTERAWQVGLRRPLPPGLALYTLPEVDRDNIGIIGHSLGGKMAMYAAAFEPRITVAVGSDHGIGLEFSNYEDYWYLDDSNTSAGPGHGPPRAAGADSSPAVSADRRGGNGQGRELVFINEAQKVYSLYGQPDNIGFFNHRTGHSPTPEAVTLSLRWLERFLGPGN